LWRISAEQDSYAGNERTVWLLGARATALAVLGFGLLQNGDFGISVFPQRQKILVGGLGFGPVATRGVGVSARATDGMGCCVDVGEWTTSATLCRGRPPFMMLLDWDFPRCSQQPQAISPQPQPATASAYSTAKLSCATAMISASPQQTHRRQ